MNLSEFKTTSALLGAWKCNFPPGNYDRPTNRRAYKQKDMRVYREVTLSINYIHILMFCFCQRVYLRSNQTWQPVWHWSHGTLGNWLGNERQSHFQWHQHLAINELFEFKIVVPISMKSCVLIFDLWKIHILYEELYN